MKEYLTKVTITTLIVYLLVWFLILFDASYNTPVFYGVNLRGIAAGNLTLSIICFVIVSLSYAICYACEKLIKRFRKPLRK